MSSFQIKAFFKQLAALIHKNFLTAVIRHPISFILKNYGLQLAVLVVLLHIPYFISDRNTYGIGDPAPIIALKDSITNGRLIIVKPDDLGLDIDRVVQQVTEPLKEDSYKVVTSDDDILELCRASVRGISDCHATVTFEDSPLTQGGNKTWVYTMRGDAARNDGRFKLEGGETDSQKVFMPLQLAVENAITNSTAVPKTFPYTPVSQEVVDEDNKFLVQRIMADTAAFSFIVTFFFTIWHLSSLVTKERESGMSKLIDAMGGSATARVLSYLIVFDIIYFPMWIAFGALYNHLIWPDAVPLGLAIGWQILLGLAINSSAVFAAAFFTKGRVSSVYIVGGFLLLGVAAQVYTQSLEVTTPSKSGIIALALLFPSSNLVFFFQQMSDWQSNHQPANINLLPPSLQEALDFDEPRAYDVKAAPMLGFLALQIFFYPVLAIVAEHFFHGISNSNRRFTNTDDGGGASSVVVETKELKKTFNPGMWERLFSCFRKKSVEAVKSVSLQGHRGQILGLVGPNGSGKTTTLQMIAGFVRPSSGGVEIDALPSQLGVCPQNNTFWHELSVYEHIRTWNAIKSGDANSEALQSLIDACDLHAKTNARAGSLSGGQMRKLQLACMFVGNSSVCLIDECTSGLDPLSRRAIWEILMQQRAKRSIVFTTHFLDEVEVLADHIVILDEGLVKASGPAAELKGQYGGGYKVSVPKDDAVLDEPESFVHQDRRVYSTPTSSSAAALAQRLSTSGSGDVSILGPQIEDVFLHVADSGRKILAQHNRPAQHPDLELTPGKITSFWTQVRVLLWKRLVVMKRFWWPYLWVLCLPLVIIPQLKGFLRDFQIADCDPLEVYLQDAYSSELQIRARSSVEKFDGYTYEPGFLLGGDPSLNESLADILQKNLTDFIVYNGRNFSEEFNLTAYNDWIYSAGSWDEFMALLEAKQQDVSPGAIYADSNVKSNDGESVLGFSMWGYGYSPQLLNLWSTMRGGLKIISKFGFMSMFGNRSFGGRPTEYNVFFTLVLALYPAAFVLYPSLEKARKVRSLQYANGIRRAPLWVAYLLFDLFFVLVISAGVTAIVSTQPAAWLGSFGYLFIVLFLYGLAAVLVNQIVTAWCRGPLAAFFVAFGWSLVMYFLVVIVYAVALTQRDIASIDGTVLGLTYGLNLFLPIGNVWRTLSIGRNVQSAACTSTGWVTPHSMRGYGTPILYLVIQVFVYLGILILLEREISVPSLFSMLTTKVGNARYAKNPGSSGGGDSDLEKSKNSGPVVHVSEVDDERCRAEGAEGDLLRVLHAGKRFGRKVAVEDVTLGLGEGECMALIGPNGAGKSTLVNMIRAELRPDGGRISLKGEDAMKAEAQKHLGVCPQYDALDLLSTREQLKFYAKIKGIEDVDSNVNNIMRILDLTPHATTAASKLSGGNKRKLSLAIALMGTPQILILDEPTSAMDALAKRSFWHLITNLTPRRAVLLTTHSMEEADFLASRAAIISRRLLAVGTTQALRHRYSHAHYVHLLLATAPHSSPAEMDRVAAWALGSVRGARLERRALGGQVRVVVERGTGGEGEGEGGVVDLIRKLEGEKEALGIEYYSVGGATLENVFLGVVRENDVQEMEEGTGRSGWLKWW